MRLARAGVALPGFALTLDRYIACAVLRAYGLVACGLTVLFSLLAFVEQLALVGKGSYRVGDALLYVLLTAPLRLVRLTPVALLVGSLFALGALGRNSELIAMRGVGRSERRIMGAVLRLIVPISLVLFLLMQFVVPPAQQSAEIRRASALAAAASGQGGSAEDGIWVHGERVYLHVRRMASATEAVGVDIYAFGADGGLARAITAERAEIGAEHAWTLHGVRETTVDGETLRTRQLATLPWNAFVSASRLRLLAMPLEAMPPVALWDEVRVLHRTHQQGLRYELELWRRIALPLAMAAMIMAAGPFVFAPPRTQNLGRLISAGALIGIVFTLAQQITAHLALLLGLDAAAAALGPPLVVLGLAAVLLRRG